MQDPLQDINAVENGILLEHNAHVAFRGLEWGIEPRTENGNRRYFIKTFGDATFVHQEAGSGTEPQLSSDSGHKLPNPDLCPLHLAVCAVASACGAAEFSTNSSKSTRTSSVQYLGNTRYQQTPLRKDVVVPYFERRLFEEGIHVPPLQIF